jgi:hypothetical protein
MESKLTLQFFILVIFCISHFSLIAQTDDTSTCDDLSITAQITGACASGSKAEIKLIINQGFPPYQVAWEDGVNTPERKLSVGTYRVQVTDALGCQQTGEFTIPQKPPISVVPTVKHTSKAGKKNGEIILSVNGGAPPYRFTWISSTQGVLLAVAEGANQLKKLPQGTYQILVFDAAGCYSELETEVR